MKTLKTIILIIAGFCLMGACSKDEPAITTSYNVQNDNLDCGKVFKIEATKGTDITASLKDAFEEAIEAGPGSTVELPEGEFELSFIEIREFYGSFVGAGTGKTIIKPKTGLECTAIESQGLWKFLINFVGGNILMSNMTLKITDEAICSDGKGLDGFVIFEDYNNIYTSMDNIIKVIVNNVEFIGNINYCWDALAGGQNSKVNSGLNRSNVEMTITNCTFDGFGYGTQLIGTKKGKYTLGTKNNGNTFSNCFESVFLYDVINVPVEVVDNRFNTTGYELDFENTPLSQYVVESQTSCSLINIEGNEFNVTYNGIRIFDGRRSENMPVMVVVKNNLINLMSGSSMGVNIFNLKDAVIRNNRFNGSSQYGVRVRTRPPDGIIYNENGLLLGNNFSNTAFSVASVFLEPYTRNWTIVGGDLGESITNFGQNNLITGFNVNDSEDPFGQTIVDNLEEMRETMLELNGH
jgi:hypothetical protein